ncbi:MAG: divalent-cation tolerance protein CutA [Acidimicrobiales bacterium]
MAYALVMTTTDSPDEAESLARSLVEARLAACVQLTPIVSHYVWEGTPTRAAETLLLAKTRADRVADITRFIEEHHSYDTPEVVALPIESGSAAYLRWIDSSL